MSMNFLRSASGKPISPPPFALSPVERTHSWRAYLWPFQSRRESVVMLRAIAVTLLLCSIVVWLFFAPQALPYALTGGLAGGLWLGPYRSLPAEMTITTLDEARHHLGDVQKLLMKLGFVRSAVTTEPGHYHYLMPPPPAYLLPLSVPEVALDLRVHEHTIHLESHIRLIDWLHRQLARELEA